MFKYIYIYAVHESVYEISKNSMNLGKTYTVQKEHFIQKNKYLALGE